MGSQGRRTLSALASALVVAGIGAGGAQAAPTWLQPVPLSSPPGPQNFFQLGAGTPDVAFDGGGNAYGTWQRTTEGGPTIVQLTTRAPGAGFAPPVDMGATLQSGIGLTDGPQIEVDVAGNAALAFATDDGRIVLSRRAPGGGFPAPLEISTGTGNNSVDIAMSGNGHLIVAWKNGVDNILVRTATPGGELGAAADFGPDNGSPSFALTPQLAINGEGAAVVTWVEDDAAPNSVVRARVRPPGGAFGAEQLLSAAGADASSPDVAIDGQGRATAVWQRVEGADVLVQSKQSNPAGQFPAAADPVSNVGIDATLPQVVVDAENTAVAVWNNGNTVAGASRQSNASFGDPQPISAPGANTGLPPRLAVDAGGNVVAVWAPSGANSTIQAARRPKGGSFGAVEPLPRPDTVNLPWGPAIALDNEGNALALWGGETEGDFWTVYANAYDVAPPTLSAVSVPSAGTAGQPVGMAAAATDRWSPVSYAWSFGDGGSAGGGAVSHAFGAPGAFNVTVTATDGVGNATSATRPISISPAAVPPKKRVTSKVRVTWGVNGKRIFLLRLQARNVPRGGKAELRCKGKKCPFKRKSSKKRRNTNITLFSEVKASKVAGKKARRFRAGQRLELRITAPEHIGKVVRYRLKKGKIPSGKTLCLPPGAKTPRRRC